MKLNIAVCEDDYVEQVKMEQLVKLCKKDVSLEFYNRAEDFLSVFEKGKYDLILMDIMLGSMTGVEATREIRVLDGDVPVIFTTGSLEYALEGYRLGVLKYIEKPVRLSDVEEALHLAEMIKINTVKKRAEISLDASIVMFAEQNGHMVKFHLSDGQVIEKRMKLDVVETVYGQNYFFRCHKSFLVNMNFVKAIDKELMVFIMQDGSNAYIKRELLKEAILKMEN